VNLPPRKMQGVVSEGMLFDIGYADGITPVLVTPESPAPAERNDVMSTNGRYTTNGKHTAPAARNVLGGLLATCSTAPLTSFYRTGCCDTGPDDLGVHVVCAQVAAEFLAFSRSRGNDLSTPRPEYGFPGLKPGDRWCLCADRWQEALEAGVAPPVVLAATHEAALEITLRVGASATVRHEDLLRHAVDVAGGAL
jgi:uncharacterized protein (DUF2237 family)